jgi:hypothetical protein
MKPYSKKRKTFSAPEVRKLIGAGTIIVTFFKEERPDFDTDVRVYFDQEDVLNWIKNNQALVDRLLEERAANRPDIAPKKSRHNRTLKKEK